jgi:hypothetical protein
MAIENKGNKGLVVGKADPNTIGTYSTKGFNHEGVSGSEPVDRLNEVKVSDAITPQVITDNSSPGIGEKIVKDDVSKKSRGNGTDGNKPVDSYKAEKSQSAGNIGANNANHA